MKASAFLLLLFLSYALSSKNCYDCSPSDPGNCLSPDKNNIRLTNCLEDEEREGNTEETFEHECYTIYAKAKDGDSGIYRGCNKKNETSSVCEDLKSQLPDYELVKCTSCSAEACNTENLEDSGTGGAAETALSSGFFVIFLLSLILN